MADMTDFIQQVKRANDIVDVIGSYLELRLRGTTYFARCPFHGEKTASFSVNRNMQIFHCFGCGESGDVIGFVQKYESCTFMEALEILAKRANLKMPETATQRQDKEFSERKKKKDVYFNICRDTAVFYYKSYYASRGEIARNYVAKRGFDVDTVKKFGIGYSPDRYSLVKYLESKGYATEDCLKAGVVQQSTNSGIVDALSGRLIIPIFNMQGKVIAFGGRGLDDKTIAFGKYKNTSDTPLFTKKDNLFALNVAKEQKQQTALPNLVVVEGYMDVIAMYQAGFRRAVASMGTSLTEQQAKWLSRLTDTVYICYDGDAAGQKATVRGLDILDKAGLEVKVMTVPEKLDPDEYIGKYGKDAFEQLIGEALPLPDYKLKLLDDAFDIKSSDSAVRNNALPKYVQGALTMLRSLDDARQARYITAVSLRTGYSEDYFRRKLTEVVSSGDEALPDVTVAELTPEDKAKYFMAACLLRGESYATIEEKPLCNSAFLSKLFDYVLDCKEKNEKPTVDMLYTLCPNAQQEEYAQIIEPDFSKARQDKNERYYAECKRLVTVEKLKRKREELMAQIKNNPNDSSLLEELTKLSKKITNAK
ncbi:MAG: DNA primase [Clostridiales bacterium]|nr:DNA primase [Clostridiales bacterium]